MWHNVDLKSKLFQLLEHINRLIYLDAVSQSWYDSLCQEFFFDNIIWAYITKSVETQFLCKHTYDNIQWKKSQYLPLKNGYWSHWYSQWTWCSDQIDRWAGRELRAGRLVPHCCGESETAREDSEQPAGGTQHWSQWAGRPEDACCSPVWEKDRCIHTENTAGEKWRRNEQWHF